MYIPNTRRFLPVAVRLIKHRPVPGRALSGAQTGIGRLVKRLLKGSGACQTTYDVRSGTVRYLDCRRWNHTLRKVLRVSYCARPLFVVVRRASTFLL